MNNLPIIDRHSNQEAFSDQIGIHSLFADVLVSVSITPEHCSQINSLHGMNCFIPVGLFL